MVTKQHILDEIRRTAESNGGEPLGRSAFLNSTGIREVDWRGRYWARWSEAVREAGYAPNALQGSHSEELLLGKLAVLTRERGRIPTWSELVLARTQDATIPNEKAYRRFGRKADVARKLMEFCEAHPEYSDVAGMCEPAMSNESAAEPAARESDTDVEFGFVYLLKSGRYYKIGRTNAAGRRERELQIQLPERAKTVHTIRTDDPAGIEDYWHRRFADRRMNGEWFDLTAADVTAFKRRKFQ